MVIKIILMVQHTITLVVAVDQVVVQLEVETVETVAAAVLLMKEVDQQVQVDQEEIMVEMVHKEVVKPEVQEVLILVVVEAVQVIQKALVAPVAQE